MSGEYYILEEIVDQDSDTNLDAQPTYQNGDNSTITTSSRAGKESKLHDIEKQLEMAESRCSSLKSQLDYMKNLYGAKQKESKANNAKCITTNRISTLKKRYENKSNNEVKTNESTKITKSCMVTQTSDVDLCEELKTNDRSVIVQNATLLSIVSEANNQNKTATKMTRKKDRLPVTESKKLTVKIPKVMTDNNFSSHAINKSSKKSLKKTQSTSVRSCRKRKITSNTKYVNTTTQISDLSAHKLVEIYHNTAAKGSDSDDSHSGKRTRHKRPITTKISQNEIPPLRIHIKTRNDVTPSTKINIQEDCRDVQICNVGDNNDNNNNTENQFQQEMDPNKQCSVYSKNYTLPTIASRLKQVAKNYLTTYNFKAIPFCAAIATTPSHNIGINIQQVMNIIKTRQPIQGLSPTLTHNIVLAANKLNCAPLSTFISSITSKADYGLSKNMCPMTKSLLNYHQLEEMAKAFPDEGINDDHIEIAENEPIETTTITGPTGEFQIHNQQQVLWSMETNDNMCTCVPQSGLELQQVVTKYQSNHTIYTNSQLSGTTTRRAFKRITAKGNRLGTGDTRNCKMKTISEQIIPHHEELTPLQGKERNLKEVLTNLHNDFEILNKKYDELVDKANEKGDDEELNKELTRLEGELNNKEEEITMVMALYKEVLALKQQIKSLKQKASKQVINNKGSISQFQDYNNPRAAFHLTKLLRQIQHYQLHYKKSI